MILESLDFLKTKEFLYPVIIISIVPRWVEVYEYITVSILNEKVNDCVSCKNTSIRE